MKKILLLLVVLCTAQMLAGCAIVHRYPTYRGTVLELGTDKPIERAGILMAYWSQVPSVGGWIPTYRGYQWALTDKDGKFKIPAKYYFGYRFLETFIKRAHLSMHKKGYGNYPGSFREGLARRARTEPEFDEKKGVPGGKEVTYWLPKLETPQEFRDHRGGGFVLGDPFVLPPGMTQKEFGELFNQ